MNEEQLNTSVRRFLKRLGITAHREIEEAVRSVHREGRLPTEPLAVEARIRIPDLDLEVAVDGSIETP